MPSANDIRIARPPRKDWVEITEQRMEKLADDPRLTWDEREAFTVALGAIGSILREERGTVREPNFPGR